MLCFYDEDDAVQINIVRNAGGSISVLRGSTTLATTSDTGLISIGSAFNIEALVTIDESAGSVRVWLNGVELTDLAYSGDTLSTSNSNVRYVGIEHTPNVRFYWHDLIIDDDPTDTILGNCYAKTRKIASVSSNIGFAAEGDETDIPTILNQTSPDGTDYIEASADGDAITLALEAGDEDDTDIRSLTISALVQKNGDGDCNGTLSATVNGTNTSGDETALSNGYTSLSVNVTGGLSSDYADAATITLTRSE